MNEDITKLIDEELVRELEELESLDPGDKEYLEALAAIERLHKLKLEAEKVDLEYTEKRENRIINNGRADEELRLREAEEARALAEQKNRKKEFWIKLAADAGTTVAALAFFGLQWAAGYIFEEKGTYTSTTFKEVRQKAFGTLFRRK